MQSSILILLLGLAEILLGLLVFHRVMPVALQKGKASAARALAFGTGLALLGVANGASALGYPTPGWSVMLGQACFVACAILWAERLPHSPIKGWADAGQAKARQKGEARG